MADDAALLASAYYSLFTTFHEWYQIAVGERPPPGLVLRPVRSADEEWPLGALLPAVVCLLRSRLARIERLRSMRRWHMLYTSHNTMLPCSSSHLSCLARARRSLAEWSFYSQLTHAVLGEATSELERARLIHGLREWRRAAEQMEARFVYATTWGHLSGGRHCFAHWARYALASSEREDWAMSCALGWIRSAGPRVVVAVAFRALATVGRQWRALRKAAGAVVHQALHRGWEAWKEAVAEDQALRLAWRKASGLTRGACRRRRLANSLNAWRGGLKAMAAEEREQEERDEQARRHSIRLASARLRRGWWVWHSTLQVSQSLRSIASSARARVSAQHALQCWAAYLGVLASWHALADSAAVAFDGKSARRFVWCLRHWRVGARRWRDRRSRLAKALVELWVNPSRRRAIDGLRQAAKPRRCARRAVHALRHLHSARAWRSWRSAVGERRVRTRLVLVGASYFREQLVARTLRAVRAASPPSCTALLHRLSRTLPSCTAPCTASCTVAAPPCTCPTLPLSRPDCRLSSSAQVRLWRRRCSSGASRPSWHLLAASASKHLWRRAVGVGFAAFLLLSVRARLTRDNIVRGTLSREVGRKHKAWWTWSQMRHVIADERRLLLSAGAVWRGKGVRRFAWRAMQAWRAFVEWREVLAGAAYRWAYPHLQRALELFDSLRRRRLASATARRFVVSSRQSSVFFRWHGVVQAASIDGSILASCAAQCLTSQLLKVLLTWRAAASDRLRRELSELRHSRDSTLDGGARMLHRHRLRAALHKLHREAAHRFHRSRRVKQLGRHLERLVAGSMLHSWRTYAEYDLIALARAADAFPTLHRRGHLRHWHARARAARERAAKGGAVVARWRKLGLARSYRTWLELTQAARATLLLVRRVHLSWANREAAAAWRTWAWQVRRVVEALEAMRRALGSLRNSALALGWRGWKRQTAERLAAVAVAKGALRRLLHQNVSRALLRWREKASARLDVEALVAKCHPRGRLQHAALRTWVAACDTKARVLRAIAGALRHAGRALLVRVLRAWVSTVSRTEALRRQVGLHFLHSHGVSRALRTWQDVLASRQSRRAAKRAALTRMLRQAEVKAFVAIKLAAKAAWLLRTSAARWRRLGLSTATVSWRGRAEGARRAHAGMFTACKAFFGWRVPSAWAVWEGLSEAGIRRRRLARRAMAHWTQIGVVVLWQRWAARARDGAARDAGGARATLVRQAFSRLKAERTAVRSSRLSCLAVLALTLGHVVLRWHAHAHLVKHELALLHAALLEWRDGAIAMALASIRLAARGSALMANRFARADTLRALRAVRAWSECAAQWQADLELVRGAAHTWRGGVVRHVMARWAAAARRHVILHDTMSRWLHETAHRGFHAWVAYAVECSSLALALASLVHRDKARGWRAWAAAVQLAREGGDLVEDGLSYWRRAFTAYSFVRWAQHAAQASPLTSSPSFGLPSSPSLGPPLLTLPWPAPPHPPLARPT